MEKTPSKTPVLFRRSLREWRNNDGTAAYAMFFSPDKLKDSKRSPVIDCGSEWPSDAKRRLVAAYIEDGSACILKFDDLNLSVEFFRATTGKPVVGSAE